LPSLIPAARCASDRDRRCRARPVCYGAGTELTVTDANLLLGRLDPEFFLGGRMALDVARTDAVARNTARSLKLSVGELAEGIVRVANANMERAIRVVSVERGHDPRGFRSWPSGRRWHARVRDRKNARDWHCDRAETRRRAVGAGMLVADVTRDYSASVLRSSDELPMLELKARLTPLVDRAVRELSQEGFEPGRIRIEQQLDVRYVGQSYEITLPLTAGYRS